MALNQHVSSNLLEFPRMALVLEAGRHLESRAKRHWSTSAVHYSITEFQALFPCTNKLTSIQANQANHAFTVKRAVDQANETKLGNGDFNFCYNSPTLLRYQSSSSKKRSPFYSTKMNKTVSIKALILLLIGTFVWLEWGTITNLETNPLFTGLSSHDLSSRVQTFETIQLSGNSTSTFPVNLQTAAWMFNAVHNTMRILGNTVARNGLSFVPGYIPAGTLFYHGKIGPSPPSGMEWLAFDPEYSLNMLQGPFWTPNNSYLLTFTNIKPLKVLNIDGASAALFPDGTFDSQGFVLNQTKSDWIGFKEYERANLLCEFGKELGVDGYIRLNTGFELIVCSFENPKLNLVSNVKLLSTPLDIDDGVLAVSDDLHLLAARKPAQTTLKSQNALGPPPQNDLGRAPQNALVAPRKRNPVPGFEWVQSGVRHFYGDPRVIPDFRGFVSIYGRDKFNLEGPIYTHRLYKAPISLQQEIRSDLLAVMSVDQPALDIGQAINWQTVTDEIVGKFKPLLVSINETFNALDNDQDLEKARKKIQIYTTSLVRRFTNYSNGETTNSPQSLENCINSWDPSGQLPLTNLEKRILASVRQVTTALCQYSYDAHRWVSLNPSVSPIQDLATRIKNLIDTLGWVDFMQCPEKCAANQVCYFPMWPYSRISDQDYNIGLRCFSIPDY